MQINNELLCQVWVNSSELKEGTSPDNNAVFSISPHTIDSACLLKLLEKKKQTNKEKPSFLAFLNPFFYLWLKGWRICVRYNSILRSGPEPSSDEIHLWGMGDSPLGPEFLLCWTWKVSSEKARQMFAVGLSGQLLCFVLCLQPDLIRRIFWNHPGHLVNNIWYEMFGDNWQREYKHESKSGIICRDYLHSEQPQSHWSNRTGSQSFDVNLWMNQKLLLREEGKISLFCFLGRKIRK